MGFKVDLRRYALALFIGATLMKGTYARGSLPATSSNGNVQTGRILSVRKVLRNQLYISSRYPQIHYYDVFFGIHVSDQTYCAEYTTPVLDEVDDLVASNGKDIEVTLKKSKLIARTLKRHKIKAHLVNEKQCSAPATSQR